MSEEKKLSLFAAPSADHSEQELGSTFRPRFNADGLITCVTTNVASGQVLMVAFMNEEALRRTLETGEVWYWSRSRAELWHKGATSGQIQKVVGIRVDCDQDALLLEVIAQGDGGCCHTGHYSCFFRAVDLKDPQRLEILEKEYEHHH